MSGAGAIPFGASDLASLDAFCQDLPALDQAAVTAAHQRDSQLTKPPGALGELEALASWMAGWQGQHPPRADDLRIAVFAGNHGVTAQGVSPYPAAVTAQMVANFDRGGAAINALQGVLGARLDVIALDLDCPTEDFTQAPALTEGEFLAAVRRGYEQAAGGGDLLCLGEMGIGNTTAASAVCLGLFGGDGRFWAGPGTGLDPAGVSRKAEVLDRALARHRAIVGQPLEILRCLGGRELAALFGAVLGARKHRIPVMLDGFVVTAAAAPLAQLVGGGLDHCRLGHCSAEPGHLKLAEKLGLQPLLQLGMRLGEASGAALAAHLVKAAVACHTQMASFAEAGVTNRD